MEVNHKLLNYGIQASIVIVAILSGVVGYFAATQVIAVLLASILGIGVGWVPSGIPGIVVRGIVAIFMVIFCTKNYKKWIDNRINV